MYVDAENFSIDLDGYRFVQTCCCSPEQYDVYQLDKFDSTEPIGYVRLRFGNLSASCPNTTGVRVYTKKFQDEWKGKFSSLEEREFYLKSIAAAIDHYYDSAGNKDF